MPSRRFVAGRTRAWGGFARAVHSRRRGVGLIVPLGDWALEQACRQLASWQRAVPMSLHLQVHVNVSAYSSCKTISSTVSAQSLTARECGRTRWRLR